MYPTRLQLTTVRLLGEIKEQVYLQERDNGIKERYEEDVNTPYRDGKSTVNRDMHENITLTGDHQYSLHVHEYRSPRLWLPRETLDNLIWQSSRTKAEWSRVQMVQKQNFPELKYPQIQKLWTSKDKVQILCAYR